MAFFCFIYWPDFVFFLCFFAFSFSWILRVENVHFRRVQILLVYGSASAIGIIIYYKFIDRRKYHFRSHTNYICGIMRITRKHCICPSYIFSYRRFHFLFFFFWSFVYSFVFRWRAPAFYFSLVKINWFITMQRRGWQVLF